MTKDKALESALEALIYASSYCDTYDAIAAIKQALAAPVQSCYCPNCEAMGKELAKLKAQPAPVQEPVGYVAENGVVDWNVCAPPILTDLYTTPPAAQPAPVQPVGTVKDLFTQAAWEKLDVRGSTKVYLATPPAAPVQEEDLYDLAVKADNGGQP